MESAVKTIVEKSQRQSEILICALLLAIGILFTGLYILSPKGAADLSDNLTIMICSLFVLISGVRLFLACRYPIGPWLLGLFVLLEPFIVGFLIWSYHLTYQASPALYLHSTTPGFFYLLIALRGMRNDAPYVWVSGITSALVWTGLTAWALHIDPGARTHSFIEYATRGRILVGAEVERVITILLVTFAIAGLTGRGRRILEDSAAYFVRTREELRRRNAALQLEKEKAEASVHAKERFLKVVTHELRTPLNGILGISQLLKPGQAEEDDIRLIHDQSQHLLGLVNRIIDYSSIDRDKAGEHCQVIRIGSFLSGCIGDFRRQRACAVSLTTDGDFGVRINSAWLRTIVTELLGNALDHGQGEGIRLQAQTGPGEGEFTLTIEDAGPGIPAGLEQDIFAPFFQAEDPLDRHQGGVGMGLTLVQRMINSMCGSIRATALRPGLRLSIRLPVEPPQCNTLTSPEKVPA